MILNIIHRFCRGDIYDCFEFQQKTAHELGFKTTVNIPSTLLSDDNCKAFDKLRADAEKYGDELCLWIMPDRKDIKDFVWLLSEQDKLESIEKGVAKFKQYIGYAPKSILSYVMDSSMIRMIREISPETVTVAAGCFEEGTKVFHGCNNSWYLFSEGMCWNPWYPSKTHSIRPARNEDDWAGVVAIPHLSRDLALAYEGRNDFFASHPPNIQRGLVNEKMNHNYDYNLIDQYRLQEDFNDGFSYYQIHVGSGWLHGNPNVLDSDEITYAMYKETLEYAAELMRAGEIQNMTTSEFGEYYKKNIPIEKPTVALAKEMLYGSGKHYFWICSPAVRALVDCNQGGSIGDLRPFIGEFEAFTGVDSPMKEINTYPYLIQSQIRTGTKTHFADGSRTTLFVKCGAEEIDCCFVQTKTEKIERVGNNVTLTLTPMEIKFKNGEYARIQTLYEFSNNGEIKIKRKILEKSTLIELREYFKGCYGFTEYPEDLSDITLFADDEILKFSYNAHSIEKKDCKKAGAVIPGANVTAEYISDKNIKANAKISDGYLFNPYYTFELKYKIVEEKECVTCLILTKT